jgi:predicted AAA+ superfamily ATPase
MEFINRLLKKPKESFFLFGPRGTGKSTWVNAAFKNALVVNLLQPDVFRRFAARPETLRDLVGARNIPGDVLIDEVQKVPEILDAVHQLLEEKRGLRFILTGSSARKLKRSGVDLLAGRAGLMAMHPFMATELGADFSLEEALRTGLLPVVRGAKDPGEALKGYAALYLREEVQMEGLVRNIGAFARFLEAASFSHAAVLNVSNIARDCEIERKTVEGYLAILQDLLLAFQLPVFTRKAKRQLSGHPKLYLFDAGVFQALRPRGPLDRTKEIAGAALEGLVGQHLRAWAAYSTGKNDLFFWRTRSGVEVDFVVYGDAGFWAIEVKNSARISDNDLRPLRFFMEDFHECRPIYLYRGRERQKRHGVLCLPCDEFLRQLKPDMPLVTGPDN